MRSFALFSILLTCLSIGFAHASFSQACHGGSHAEICGEPSNPVRLPVFRHGTTMAGPRGKRMTNAQRLSRGLPPLPPTRRAESCLATGPPSPQASAVPQTPYEGIIEVRRTSNDAVIGYISTMTSSPAGFFPTTTSTSSALVVTFSLDPGATTGSHIALTMTNSQGPLLGFVQGRDSTSSDISSTSFNYLYLNGIALPGSGPGCPPTSLVTNYSPATNRAAESSLWSVDLNTGALVPQWINSDFSTPTTQLWTQSGYLYGGGSSSAFEQRYPAPVTPVSLYFIPFLKSITNTVVPV